MSESNPNTRLGLGKYGPLSQLGAVGFVCASLAIGGNYVMTSQKELQSAVLQDVREARREDLAERSADRERTLKLAEAIAKIEESHGRQLVMLQQQTTSMERIASAMERLKLTKAAPLKKDENRPEIEEAPMPSLSQQAPTHNLPPGRTAASGQGPGGV